MPNIVVYRDGIWKDDKLTDIAREIADYCIEKYKLNFDDIEFYLLNKEKFYELMATSGFFDYPETWEVGQNYYLEKKGHELGNWRVYEFVINSAYKEKPVRAYISKDNTLVDMKLVIAHVFGHAHVYKNNYTQIECKDEDPSNLFAEFQKKYKECEFMYGNEIVESVYEIGDALSTLIDIYPIMGIRKNKKKRKRKDDNGLIEKKVLPSKDTYNVFKFLIENVDVKEWVKDILKLWYRSALYFYRGSKIKIIHEGFASLIDAKYGIENLNMSPEEAFDWIKHRTSGWKGSIDSNPYKLGAMLFKDIEAKYGWEMVLDIVATKTDHTFISEYFTKDLYYDYTLREIDIDGIRTLLNLFGPNNPSLPIYNEMSVKEYLENCYKLTKSVLLFRTFNLGLPRIKIPADGFKKDEIILEQDVKEIIRFADEANNAFKNIYTPIARFFMFTHGKKFQPIFISMDKDRIIRTMKAINKITGKKVILKTYGPETIDENDPKFLELFFFNPDRKKYTIIYYGYDDYGDNFEIKEGWE